MKSTPKSTKIPFFRARGFALKTSVYPSEYFDPASTLGCGQVFRFAASPEGTLVFSGARACLLRRDERGTSVTAEEGDADYFFRYFDLARDYGAVRARICALGIPRLSRAAAFGRGIRILNQEPFETAVSFILSQNNNIPRIRATLFRLCEALGEKRVFRGCEYYAFPSPQKMAERDEAFYASIGCGYRARYLTAVSKYAERGEDLSDLSTARLRERLLSLPGVGRKVADCILLFAYHRTDAFPVDTWVEKAYRELGGRVRGREKIAAELENRFQDLSGYIQQYLFYYEREGGN